MRIAIISILILSASAVLGWWQWNTLQLLREKENALVSNAARRTAGTMVVGSRRTPRERESRADCEVEAKAMVSKMIDSIKEQGVQAPGEEYRKLEQRIAIILESLYQMNASQLRPMIEELRNHPPSIDPRWYHKILSNAITALADTDPGLAIAILAEDYDRLKRNDRSSCYDNVIGKWASSDPLAALVWMRENPSKVATHEGRASFISGLAIRDPRLAFQALLEFEVYDLHGGDSEGGPNFSVAQQVAKSARTLEDRTAMLEILREISDSPGEDPDNVKGLLVSNVLYTMAEGIGTYGFERTSAWLESLNLRPGEAKRFMQGLNISETNARSDTGRWFEWMGENLSPDDFESATSQKINEWVRADPQAVEKWLTQAADGPAKHTASSIYASCVAVEKQKPE